MRRSTRTIVALAAPALAVLAFGCGKKASPSSDYPGDAAVASEPAYVVYDDAEELAYAAAAHEGAQGAEGDEDVAGTDAPAMTAPEPAPAMEKSEAERVAAPGLRSSRGDRASRREARRARKAAKDTALAVTPTVVADPTSPPPTVAVAPLPQPEHNTEEYSHIQENDFIAVADDPRSTFSIDVDTAAYSNMRRFLNDGQLPPADAVRIEELVNYFDYAYVQPRGDDPFSVTTEVAPCPWQPDHRLVHVGLQGKDVAAKEIPPRNLVFLLDVSGSMSDANKLPLLKQGMRMLARDLREQDRISIVVYAGASGVVLEPTSDRQAVEQALDRLEAGGSTNGGEGIEMAYRLAAGTFMKGGINRVILATDGDFNVGVTNEGDLVRLIEEKRETGVFLSVLGFGTGNLGDSTMELLADKGNGNYAYIDSESEAHKVLVEQAGATLMAIAKDVKIQVEWNPAEVGAYRLVGYENRRLEHRDFNDDTKDAGEIGAGHTVTALYEIVPAGRGVGPEVDALVYQSTDAALTSKAKTGELMTVKLRYKQPSGSKSKLLTVPVKDGDGTLQDSSEDFRWAAAVAEMGLLLRSSKWRGKASWSQTYVLAEGAIGKDPQGRRAEMLELVRKAAALSGEQIDMERRRSKVAR